MGIGIRDSGFVRAASGFALGVRLGLNGSAKGVELGKNAIGQRRKVVA
jgi:hypothetical protein